MIVVTKLIAVIKQVSKSLTSGFGKKLLKSDSTNSLSIDNGWNRFTNSAKRCFSNRLGNTSFRNIQIQKKANENGYLILNLEIFTPLHTR